MNERDFELVVERYEEKRRAERNAALSRRVSKGRTFEELMEELEKLPSLRRGVEHAKIIA